MRGVINTDTQPPYIEETEGERALLSRVFQDGIESIVFGPASMDRDRDMLWYRNNDTHLGGFVWYCDVLNLNPDEVRRIVDGQLREAGRQ